MKWRYALIALASTIASGCGTRSWEKYDPRNVSFDAMNENEGMVVLSTGADHDCLNNATALKLMEQGKSYGETEIMLLPIDFTVGIDGDFSDHPGHVFAIPLPAGQYYLTSWQGGYETVKAPRARFTVEPHKSTYLGEMYLAVGCSLRGLITVRDAQARDFAIVARANPSLADKVFEKRLLAFEDVALSAH
ncbi:MAG: hypothetical protein ABMA14_12620 [Hyphomonadaceae bacterium]